MHESEDTMTTNNVNDHNFASVTKMPEFGEAYEGSDLHASEFTADSASDETLNTRQRNTNIKPPSLFDRALAHNYCASCTTFQKIYFTLLMLVLTSVLIGVIVHTGIKKRDDNDGIKRTVNVNQDGPMWCGSNVESAEQCHVPCVTEIDCLKGESCYNIVMCNNSVYSLG